MNYKLKVNGIKNELDWHTAVSQMVNKRLGYKRSGTFWDDSDTLAFVSLGKNKGWKLSKKVEYNYNERFGIEQDYEELSNSDPVENDILLAEAYVNKYNSCIDRGIEFSLTFGQFKRIKSRSTCYYTLEKLNESFNNIDYRYNKSIDRIDNKIGYTKENTVLCCNYINVIKNELFEHNESKHKISVKNLKKLIQKLPKNYD